MKIGVVTLFSAYNWDNYGGALQNYALVNYLRKLGHEVYSVVFFHRVTEYPLYDKFNRFLYTEWGIRLRRKGKILVPQYIGIQKKRNTAFNQFVKKYIPRKYYRILDENSYKKVEKDYDLFVVGSDQVWNTYFALKKDTYKDYLLTFVPDEKRISYAASIGTSTINKDWEEIFKNELRKFKAISVREASGKKILKELMGIEAEELVDPTLLVTSEEWKKIERKPRFLDKKERYMITYFLGNKTEDTQNKIRVIAEKNNLKIYNLYDKKMEKLYKLGPCEFIYMIGHAEIVMTDSFHACVFSFLFERPFLVFQRKDKAENMQSRIENFLEKFNLQRKSAETQGENNLFECDYSNGKQVLCEEKKRAEEFLMQYIRK